MTTRSNPQPQGQVVMTPAIAGAFMGRIDSNDSGIDADNEYFSVLHDAGVTPSLVTRKGEFRERVLALMFVICATQFGKVFAKLLQDSGDKTSITAPKKVKTKSQTLNAKWSSDSRLCGKWKATLIFARANSLVLDYAKWVATTHNQHEHEGAFVEIQGNLGADNSEVESFDWANVHVKKIVTCAAERSHVIRNQTAERTSSEDLAVLKDCEITIAKWKTHTPNGALVKYGIGVKK